MCHLKILEIQYWHAPQTCPFLFILTMPSLHSSPTSHLAHGNVFLLRLLTRFSSLQACLGSAAILIFLIQLLCATFPFRNYFPHKVGLPTFQDFHDLACLSFHSFLSIDTQCSQQSTHDPFQSLLPHLCITRLFSGFSSEAFRKHSDLLSDFSPSFLSSVSLMKNHFQLFVSMSCFPFGW